jgi:NADPH-dependent 7-cyano-7-deazaguanine reductase QueF
MPKVEYIKYMSFGKRPTIHENYSNKEYRKLRRYISTKYIDVKGEFKPTAKEAKSSYKEALKKYKVLNKN